ncbi:MAG TPA: HAD family hydrolase [Candidatus Limnocylindrales bacterium]|nr:HAD family hydrolase [Candidatus Limnocylindrales bacterium]
MTDTLPGIEAITFDFGNTLVPVDRAGLRAVVERTVEAVVAADPAIDRREFLVAWGEERDRQFQENVPQFREVDIAERLVRVYARVRGMPPPSAEEPWDDAAAAERSERGEIERTLSAYSDAFVDGLPPVPGVDGLLVRLAASGRRLAILSNWPLAATIDRYAAARGWSGSLRAIVVSERVGVIKPHPEIFSSARSALGDPMPGAILHVGDDWAADVAGAAAVGWRTAHVIQRPADTPLPTSIARADVRPDLELDVVTELEPHLGWVGPPASATAR